MDQHQRTDVVIGLVDGLLNHVQRPLTQADDGVLRRMTAKCRWISRRLVTQLSGFVAESERIKPLILKRAHEQLVNFCRRTLLD